MEIKFYSDIIKVNENIRNFSRQYFQNAILKMGLIESEFEKIIIADKEYIDQAVNEIKPNSSYTNNAEFIVGGKCFSLEANNVYKYSLLINSLSFGGILTNIQSDDNEEIIFLKKYCNYLVYHELGHCLDYKNRKGKKEYKIIEDDRTFKIKTVSKYYISILLEEIAACYLSALNADNDVFNYWMNSINESFQNIIDEKFTLCQKYSGNPDDLPFIAFKIAGIFWIIFIELGKLIGLKLGNEYLHNATISFSSIENIRSKEVMSEFEKYVNKLWINYPNINTENTYTEILSFWKNISSSMGIKFIETENGDGILW